ncbi:MAG: hypothetical protein F4Y47_16665 [Acidobacteriia bacterium]|nr:hypothetical protein [Terriglobia bacterium]MYG02358.1 hypothetical protein [Terriglobia bacterium]MYK08800.1 hypothetical protein [Terriglobia bacterium]
MGAKQAPGRWLTSADISRVGLKHIQESARLLVDGKVDHPFSESTAYDVALDDGRLLAPKALFGVAASRALGLEVRPSHFRGGEGTPCFRAIRAAEFRIIPKAGNGDVPAQSEDQKWVEGNPVRGWHLRYERASKAVRDKKRAFRLAHGGRLECERCGLVPTDSGVAAWGEACIEVHHKVPLAELGRRRTSLDDLLCVCANCHRTLHHELCLQERRSGRPTSSPR